LEDRLATIGIFIEDLRDQRDRRGGSMEPSIASLIQSIEAMFRERGPEGMVTLATVHKAKGLEWQRVFILDASKFMPVPWGRGGGWEGRQERNLMYVAATRAARELRYIGSWIITGEEEF
jgi:superfamily I DNA/RNA helicase